MSILNKSVLPLIYQLYVIELVCSEYARPEVISKQVNYEVKAGVDKKRTVRRRQQRKQCKENLLSSI